MIKTYILLSFILLINNVEAKCGVEYTRIYGSSHSGISKIAFCNDIEMYEMCNRAQHKVDKFVNLVSQYMITNKINPTEYMNFNSLDGNCHQSITCYHDFVDPKTDKKEEMYCENIDLYNACVDIKNNFDIFIKVLGSNGSFEQILSFEPKIKCTKSDDRDIKEGTIVASSNVNNISMIIIILSIIVSIFFY